MNMSQIIGSLDRGLRILEMLGTASKPLGVTEIAKTLEVDKSTAYRLLFTLQARGYARQVQDKKYWLGSTCLQLGSLAVKAVDVRVQARRFLEELAARTEQTVHLAVLFGDEAIYVDRIHGSSVVSISTNVGADAVGHCTASGKAIFAHIPHEQLNEIYKSKELTKYTARTITDLASLESHFGIVREQGYAVDDEERYDGVRCVAAPIFNHSGEAIASFSVSGPVSRMDLKRLEDSKETVIRMASELSAELGYTGERW
jgi:DNA-binding IclR family transcriptional regulator